MMLRPRAVSLFLQVYISKGSARARERRSRKTRETRACLAFCSKDYRKKRLLVVYMVLIRWEIQKLWLENQIVRATLFVELQKNKVCDLRG